MFIGYFKLDHKVATTLANICCHHEGFLPQGAPTSPIISNIITKTLDKQFTKLAKRCGQTYYTRYADDITFSSNNIEIPSQIAILNEKNIVELSDTVINIILKNGFKINNNKVRLQDSKENQEVTGLTVNKKININRRYIKNIRAIIYSFRSYVDTPDIPLDLFKEKYKNKKDNSLIKSHDQIFSILKGRILHIAHVRGTHDEVYRKLAIDLNHILELYKSKIFQIVLPLTQEDFFMKNLFVIDSPGSTADPCYIDEEGELQNMGYGQGTGFYLKDIGLVTNYHVVSFLVDDVLEKGLKFCKKFYIEYYAENKGKQYNHKARIHCYDIEKDVAILEPEYPKALERGFVPCINTYVGEPINLLGFPGHEIGNPLRAEQGKITTVRHTDANEYVEISANIYGGNSGGPVLNSSNQVVGIATKGFTDKGVVPSQYIPIKTAIELYNAKSKENPK